MVAKRRLRRVVEPTPPDAVDVPVPEVLLDAHQEVYLADEGLVALVTGLRFDRDNDPSLKCPACGEDIAIEKGLCPECHELIRAKDPHSFESQVLPVIDAENVVYVHLDVEAGSLKFVQRNAEEKVSLGHIHLEDAVAMVPHFD